MYYQPQLNFSPDEVLDYLRKSQSDDPLLTVEEVLAKHEAMLDEWAEKHLGGKVPEENKFREVVSGETLSGRPEIQKVLKLIESPKYKAVKVVEPQRLTRGDLEDIGRLMKLLKHTNTLVITLVRTYDLRDEYDWDAFERELKRGNDYLEYTKKILNRGRLLSVSQGNFIGSRPPYGYDRDVVMEGRRKCPTLKINEAEAEVVRMIFDMYVNEDLGRDKIANRLNDLGIKPPRGKLWSAPGLKDLLENIHYIGKVKWNWRKTVTIVEDSEIIKTRPKSKIGEYSVFQGKHPAIISEELFMAARDKQGRNHRAKPTTKVRNPFSSIMFCKECGYSMVYRTNINNGKEVSAPRMMCRNQKHCHSGSSLFTEITDKVCDALEECIEDFKIRVENNEGDSVKLHANLIKKLEKRKADLEAKEISQWEAQTDPDPSKRMPQEIFKKLNEKLLQEKEEVRQALCRAYESMPEPVNYEERIATFQEALDALRDPEASPQMQNKLLKACIDRIEYSKAQPVRLKKGRSEKKEMLPTVGGWTVPPVTLDVKLKV